MLLLDDLLIDGAYWYWRDASRSTSRPRRTLTTH